MQGVQHFTHLYFCAFCTFFLDAAVKPKPRKTKPGSSRDAPEVPPPNEPKKLQSIADARVQCQGFAARAGIAVTLPLPNIGGSIAGLAPPSGQYAAYVNRVLHQAQTEDDVEERSPTDGFIAAAPTTMIHKMTEGDCQVDVTGRHPVIVVNEGTVVVDETWRQSVGATCLYGYHLLPAAFAQCLRSVIRRSVSFVQGQGYISETRFNTGSRPGHYRNFSDDSPERFVKLADDSEAISTNTLPVRAAINGLRSEKGKVIGVVVIVGDEQVRTANTLSIVRDWIYRVTLEMGDEISVHPRRQYFKSLAEKLEMDGIDNKLLSSLIRKAPVLLQAALCAVSGGQISPATVGQSRFMLGIPCDSIILSHLIATIPMLIASPTADNTERLFNSLLCSVVGAPQWVLNALIQLTNIQTFKGLHGIRKIILNLTTPLPADVDMLEILNTVYRNRPLTRVFDVITGLRMSAVMIHYLPGGPFPVASGLPARYQAVLTRVNEAGGSVGQAPAVFAVPTHTSADLDLFFQDEANYVAGRGNELMATWVGFLVPVEKIIPANEDANAHMVLNKATIRLNNPVLLTNPESRRNLATTYKAAHPELAWRQDQLNPDGIAFQLLHFGYVPEVCITLRKRVFAAYFDKMKQKKDTDDNDADMEDGPSSSSSQPLRKRAKSAVSKLSFLDLDLD